MKPMPSHQNVNFIFKFTVLLLLSLTAIVFFPWSSTVTQLKTCVTSFVIIIFLVLISLMVILKEPVRFTCKPLFIPVLVFTLYSLASPLWSQYPWAALEDLSFRLPPLVLLLGLSLIPFGNETRHVSAYAIAWSGFFCGVYGILQIIGLDVISWGKPFKHGIFSTFGHPNLFAPFLIAAMAATIFVITHSRHYKLFWYVSLMIQISCFIFTKSKGAYLGILGAIIISSIIFSKKHTRKHIIFSLFLGIVFLLVFTYWEPGWLKSLVYTNRFRIWTWKGSLNILFHSDSLKIPLLGSGAGSFFVLFPAFRDPSYIQQFRHAENLKHAHCEYLELGVELGILGFVIFFCVLFTYFKSVYQSYKSGHLDLLGKLYMTAMIGILIHNLVSVNLRWFSSWAYFCLLHGLTTPDPKIDKEKQINPHWVVLIFLLPTLILVFCSFVVSCRIFMSDVVYLKAKSARYAQSEKKPRNNELLLISESRNLDTALRWFKYNLPAMYDRAYAYSHLGDQKKAIETYEKLATMHPQYQRLYRNKAICYHKLGNSTKSNIYIYEAIASMRRELTLNDTDENHLFLAQLYQEAGDYSDAAKEIEAFILNAMSYAISMQDQPRGIFPESKLTVKPHGWDKTENNIKIAMEWLQDYDASRYGNLLATLTKKYGHRIDLYELMKNSP